jgi:transcriptional regulator with XRE-family HTH domain
MGFAENLRDELNYQGLIVKQLAAKTGINLHTLNHYLSGKKSTPPADTAVKIASALGVTVEYLVTGIELKQTNHRSNLPRTPNNMPVDPAKDRPKYIKFNDILEDLLILPDNTLNTVKIMVKAVAKQERKNLQIS